MSKPGKSTELRGILQGFNYDTRGRHDALILALDTGVAQVNFPVNVGDAIAAKAALNDALTIAAEPHKNGRPKNAHPVYDLLRLEGPKGVVDLNSRSQVKGTVRQINYSRRGEPNGAILESGDFVHLRPSGARAVELAIGLELTIEGESCPMANGHRVIEAEVVNGIDLAQAKKTAPPKKRAKQSGNAAT